MRERMLQFSQRVAAPLAVGLVLGLIGPFGTFESLAPLTRLGYWLGIVSVNWMLCDFAIRRVEQLLPVTPFPRRVAVPLAGAALVSVPATAIVVVANGLTGLGWPEGVAGLYWKVLLLLGAISVPVYALEDLAERARLPAAPAGPLPAVSGAAAGAGTAAEADGVALFRARLGAPLAGELLCLEMQDHYLAVHTTRESRLVLCRMEDAARELAALGRRVHRSWWVAERAVAGGTRDGQRRFLRLRDGRLVPVGRSFQTELRAAGWPA